MAYFVPILAALVSALMPQSSPDDGKSLFHLMQNALGGRNRIAAVSDFEQCVRATAWDDNGRPHGVVYKRTRWIKPNILRIDQIGSGNSYVVYLNGDSGWEILPDKGFVSLEGDELEFEEGYLRGLDLKSWLADSDENIELSSPASQVISIMSKGESSSRTEIQLNPATFLPAEERHISIKKDKAIMVKQRREFGDWSSFQGIKFPRLIINFHGSQKVADIRVQTIRLDGALKLTDLSRQPADLKPAMAGCGQ